MGHYRIDWLVCITKFVGQTTATVLTDCKNLVCLINIQVYYVQGIFCLAWFTVCRDTHLWIYVFVLLGVLNRHCHQQQQLQHHHQ